MTEQTIPTPSIPLPIFTDEQTEALIDFLEEQGRIRSRVQGADFSEVDYLAGCMATLMAIGRWDRLPGGWVLGPMSGRRILDAKEWQP